MSADAILAAISAHDPKRGASLRASLAVGGIPDALTRALTPHLDDPAFLAEQIGLLVDARADGCEADILAFLESGGPEMVLRAVDGTPTSADLARWADGGSPCTA